MKHTRVDLNAFNAALVIVLSAVGLVACTTPPARNPAGGSVASASFHAGNPSIVPDLASPERWQRNVEGKVIVTPDNFIRAESNIYIPTCAMPPERTVTPWIRSGSL